MTVLNIGPREGTEMKKDHLELQIKEKVRQIVLTSGADVCGIAGMERFEKVPEGFRPVDIWADCKSVICLGVALPKGLSAVSPRLIYGHYNGMICEQADRIALRSAKEIEKLGALAVPLPGDGPYEYWDEQTKTGKGLVSVKEIAVACGLGQLGKNTILLNPKYGSMLNMSVILTDLELESDPYAESICIPGCHKCVENCPAHAIGENGSVDQLACREMTYHKTARGFDTVDCNQCRTICPMRFGK